ncbi:hypothetical protein C2G38_2152815 [Gigaspora rosea]|uniref:Uncharacterized protein n=1 Tax=Gigaspora rosea TaxID=44941 RepID=A0A397WA15_9GLOM|nr:hypothetical protein C2G38_2152815 [Gigaspora rosea]
MKKYTVLTCFLFLITILDSVYALTLCNTLVFNVSQYAFGNYLSFTLGLLLAFFARPPSDDKGLFSRIKRFANQTAVIQLMLLIAFMTYMTINFFPLNNDEVPILLHFASIVMYALCGALILTQIICNSKWRHGIRILFFVPLYINQMLFQVYTTLKFPSNGYMMIFQWISILSILLAIPLYIILTVIIGFKNHERKFLYVVLYPFVFQIYLHVGYLCFYLYCDEGYLSSGLLFLSSFALFNVLHSAYNLIFTKPEFAEDKTTVMFIENPENRDIIDGRVTNLPKTVLCANGLTEKSSWGITDEDQENGINTIDAKLEVLRPYYSRIGAMYVQISQLEAFILCFN